MNLKVSNNCTLADEMSTLKLNTSLARGSESLKRRP